MAATTNENFLHPMIYTGPKDQKDVTSLFITDKRIVFEAGPLSGQDGPLKGAKYAHVTEAQGRRLRQVGKSQSPDQPDLFVWPENTVLGPQVVGREEHDDVIARLAASEASVAELTDVVNSLAGELADAIKKVDEREVSDDALTENVAELRGIVAKLAEGVDAANKKADAAAKAGKKADPAAVTAPPDGA